MRGCSKSLALLLMVVGILVVSSQVYWFFGLVPMVITVVLGLAIIATTLRL